MTRFRDTFQYLEETVICLPNDDEKACAFILDEVYFYKASFVNGLRFPIHPFIMELLHHLQIASGQLVPNSRRLIIT